MISDLAAIEAVHVLILKRLIELGRLPSFVVKGGVNLRLFFGSERYSEDMDLDGDPNYRLSINEAIAGIFEDTEFLRRLSRLGVGGLDGGQGANKDTETTYRYKFRVVRPGGVELPTRVEVSYRDRHVKDKDEVAEEEPSSDGIQRYIGEGSGILVPHYTKPAAVRQKIDALAHRTYPQARDVFDLCVLVTDESKKGLIQFLVENADGNTLARARKRALHISYAEYQSQVLEYISDRAREQYGSERMWDELRLRVAEFIERVSTETQQDEKSS